MAHGGPLMDERLLENDSVVIALQFAVRDGETGLSVPDLIKRVVGEDRWRDRIVKVTGERKTFPNFAAFVACHPPEGLGTKLETVKRLCRDDAEALNAVDMALQDTARPGERTDLFNNRKEVAEAAPVGTTKQAAIRRLRKDRPDLHARVLAGEVSPHAAMIEAGFRRPTVTVTLEPISFARLAVKHLTREQRFELIQLLQADLG